MNGLAGGCDNTFHVVKFLEENSVTVVPFSWVEGDMCAWPPFKGPKKIEDYVKALRAPESSWQRVRVVIMKSTDSYDKAVKLEEKAIFTSDLATEAEEFEKESMKRKRKKTVMYRGDTSSDDENVSLPQFPQLKRRPFIENISEQPLSPPYMQLNRTPVYQTPNNFQTENRTGEKREDIKDEIFKRKVLKMMESMQQSINEMHEMLKSSRCPLPSLPPSCPKLPCENPEDLIELEGLLDDEITFNIICDYLSTIGGSSVKDCTRRVLSKLISNKLSLKYNWKGTRGVKLAFSTFSLIIKLIFGSVRNNGNCATATQVDVNDVVKKWLMHAKDREGGRNERAILDYNNKASL